MTSSQSAVSDSDQQLSKSYQQMSRQAQEMKRRRRRRFQSQDTIEEAVVNYYSRSCQQLPFILLLTNLSAVAILITVDESVSSHSADGFALRTSRFNTQEKPADLMTSSYLLEEAGGSNRDVIISIIAQQLKNKSGAKQLTIYKSWMSTAELSHTVEAVVHLRSLGVLTAAGCGIGSVHAVVRSNLLVEPSEVEEVEM
ncbi:hypothetical protein F511_23409 [Dorcoceras hygrometricum]|uniref:Uncharacterized protein n=1 Tax=Dorcoceras hygrometricum TaxID=472368 RepID=A0A2Z7BK00_9LAMI|nr:hypothetical protein F511_23409 [Dorcoceras hygrometricum]